MSVQPLQHGEERTQDGGHELQPFRVVLLQSQLADAGQVAQDEADVFAGEEWTLEHVLQTQGGCNIELGEGEGHQWLKRKHMTLYVPLYFLRLSSRERFVWQIAQSLPPLASPRDYQTRLTPSATSDTPPAAVVCGGDQVV